MSNKEEFYAEEGINISLPKQLTVKYIFTDHAKKRIKERFSHQSESVTELLARSKIAGGAVRRYIKRECPNHKLLAAPNSKMVYWYAKTKSEKLWRVFVTTPKKATKFIVITYLEIDYAKYI